MSLDNEAAPSGGDEQPIAVHTPAGDGPISVRDAKNSLLDWRRKNAAASTEQPQADKGAPDATAEPVKESVQADAAPPQEAPGETESQPEPEVTLPPIEPPRSWTKEEKERFKSLPRETQDYLATREQERDRTFRQSQNDAAEQRKVIEAERGKVEQARQQYETALPILLQNLQSQMAGEFSDIKAMADVQRMATEDWPRYIRWDAQQKQVAAVQQEIQAANGRQFEEKRTKLSDFQRRESELLLEKVPELADETQRTKLQSSAVNVLKALDFKDQELGELWRGEKDLSVHDHRFQLILRDAVKWQEAQQKVKDIATKAKPVPPVQRPGATQPKGAAQAAELQNLNKQLETATGIKALRIATQIRNAQRAAR